MPILLTRKELAIPVPILIEAVDILLEHEIDNEILRTDEEDDRMIIGVEYQREQRDAIHVVEDLIADYEERDDDDDDDE